MRKYLDIVDGGPWKRVFVIACTARLIFFNPVGYSGNNFTVVSSKKVKIKINMMTITGLHAFKVYFF
jgi:hypothetical protein